MAATVTACSPSRLYTSFGARRQINRVMMNSRPMGGKPSCCYALFFHLLLFFLENPSSIAFSLSLSFFLHSACAVCVL